MHLMLRRHEFSSDVGLVEVTAGQSIQRMLEQAAGTADFVPVEVRIGGYPVPAELWPRLRPKAGTVIHVTPLVLQGGSARQWVAAIAMIAVSLYAPQVGAWLSNTAGFGSAAAWGAAFTVAASLAINAMVPPPAASGMGGASGTDGQWNALTGTQNAINPWGVIPFVVGEARFYPPHAALPYSRPAGGDVFSGGASYHHYLFDLGHGDLDVSEIRIGNTPIEDFEDVTWEVTRTPRLYLNDVFEDALGLTMEDSDQLTRTTATNADEISVDLLFPQGLFGISDSGEFRQANVFFGVEYRAVGASSWTAVTTAQARRVAIGVVSFEPWVSDPDFIAHPFFCRRDDRKPFTASLAWDVDAGQYEVRVTRFTSEWSASESSRVGTSNVWSVLRSSRHTNPSSTGTNKLAMRIRSSDQLTGTLQTLSVMVKQKVAVYDRDEDTWSAPTATANPAWVAWWLMTQCPALKRHVPATRMMLDAFADYAEWCDSHGLRTRLVCDYSTTARDLVQKVLAGSLAALGNRDGRYAPVYDHGDTLPSATFTPEEVRDFKVSRVFNVVPHALRVQFQNPEADWQEDEIIVLADGYSYRGVDARGAPSEAPEAEVFETLRMDQAMLPQQAWQQGRFHFAQALFRPNVYAWSSDIAGLGVTRGDVVDVCHDVPEWGAGFGRVVNVAAGGIAGAAATVRLDRAVATEAGTPYGMQVRHADGTVSVANIVASGGETDTFAIATLPAALAAGDMAIIGDRGTETAKLLVTGVRYGRDLSTSFTAVQYDARVAPYWADPPEVIVSEISGTQYGLEVPPAPEVTVITSAPENDQRDDAGITTPQVNVGVRDRGGYLVLAR